MKKTYKKESHLIEVNNVVFGYGSRPVLQGTSMRFARGTLTAIMGGSGSGKTTVLLPFDWPGQALARIGEGSRT